MKYVNNEKGFTLLLSIIIGLLFSVVLVSVVTLASSGIERNEFREKEQQATQFAEKGTVYLVSYINTRLNDAIGNTGLGQDEFSEKLEAELNNLLCTNNGGTEIDKDEQYNVCVEEHHPLVEQTDGGSLETPTQREVKIKSVGIVDDVEKVLMSTYVIGAQSEVDALNYAIITRCNQELCNDGQGEGNLFLHGSVHIEGDLKVDGHVITSSQAASKQNNNYYWTETVRPEIHSWINSSNDKPRLNLGKDIYTFDDSKNYESHVNEIDFQNGYLNVTNRLQSAFRTTPQITKEKLGNFTVNVRDSINQSKSWLNDRDNLIVQYRNNSFNNSQSQYKNAKVIVNTTNDVNLRGKNHFKRFATINESDVIIHSNNTLINVDEIMYVDGDLIIGNGRETENQNVYDQVDLIGKEIYVNGDLMIKGADLRIDANIYVNGDVNIQYSVINGGKHVRGSEDEALIIFADGKIHLSNNNVYKDNNRNNEFEPNKIRGYFYSNDVVEMFGVRSNIHIVGGISAPKVVLNAYRGTVDRPRGNGTCKAGTYVAGSCMIPNENLPSRLTIEYDPQIVNKFSNKQSTEPTIYNLEKPQLIDRE